jgi:hypothetical protein
MKRGGHLRVVRSGAPQETAPEVEQPKSMQEDPFATGIMYACMSWVACCMERPAESVAIQLLGDGVYEADVTLVGGDHTLLRVEYRIEYGLVLRCVVEPLRLA